jgi:hypothetical protein
MRDVGSGIGNPLWFEWPRMFIFAVYVRVLFENCQVKFFDNLAGVGGFGEMIHEALLAR